MNESPLDLLARAGLAARGLVYLLLGLIAVGSGLTGLEKDKTSTAGALSWLREQPFGEVLLLALGIGLLLFSLWRFSQSVFNADDRDGALKDWLVRIGTFGSGLGYLGLGGYALQLAIGWARSSDTDGREGMVRLALSQPLGPALVLCVGLIFAGVGLGQIWRGVSLAYLRHVDLPDLPVPILHAIATWGISGRGVLFVIAGCFLIYAGLTLDPSGAGSLSDALDWLRQLPFGLYLYLAAAFGLLAFGLFGLAQSVYRHVDVAGYDEDDFHVDPSLLKIFGLAKSKEGTS